MIASSRVLHGLNSRLPSHLPSQILGWSPEVSLAPGLYSAGAESLLVGGAHAHDVDAVEVVKHPTPSF